jgi:DNA-binding transcriptional LysR family regulator
VRLFDRLGKKTRLTDAGQQLLLYAEKMLGMAEEARLAVASSGEPAGALVITAPETLCAYRLPGVLGEFRRQFARVQLVFRPLATNADWQRQLRDGTADAAIVLVEPFPAPQMIIEPLLQETILVLAHPQHPLTRRQFLAAHDLGTETLLLSEAGCAYRRLFERFLHQDGVRPATILEFHSVEAIKQCAMSGLGIAVLPEVAVAQEIAQGRLAVLPWRQTEATLMTLMAWHKDKWLSPALRAFLDVTRTVLKPFVPTETAQTFDPARRLRQSAAEPL